jgi:ATP adenylyltransferase
VENGYFFSFDKMSYVRGRKPQGCILCLIRDRNPELVDLSFVRNEFFIASVNLYPYNPGHLLVYPQRHLEDVRELTPDEERVFSELQRYLLDLLDREYSPRGYNIGFNMGGAAGASIDHLHLHIIPRYTREIGIAELIAGKRALVEDPRRTAERLRALCDHEPFSSSMS